MRISNQEKTAFITILSSYVTAPCQLCLFGSRADDKAKGGDIDLLLILDNEENRQRVAFDKANILAQIKNTIGDQKIDLILTTQEGMEKSAFLQSVFEESIQLHAWL